MTVSERIYIIGGTGNVGKPVVEGLLKAKVPVTVLTRTPDKTLQLYSSLQQDDLLKAVQGDHSDFTAFKESIPGHTRLFLLTPYFGPFDGRKLKTGYAKIAYAAGVKQIVDISATAAGFGWRASFLADLCRQIEEAILAIPNRGAYVALRPTRFMSNNVMYNKHGIVNANAIFEPIGPDELEEWVSPNDIGAVAIVIFQEPIEKHADPVYKVGQRLHHTKAACCLFLRSARPRDRFQAGSPH